LNYDDEIESSAVASETTEAQVSTTMFEYENEFDTAGKRDVMLKF